MDLTQEVAQSHALAPHQTGASRKKKREPKILAKRFPIHSVEARAVIPIHRVADSFVKRLTTTFNYAFARGRKALGPDKTNVDAAISAIKRALEETLPKTLRQIAMAGGKVGESTLRKLKTAGGLGSGGPGSGNFGHVGRPGEVGGSGEGTGSGPHARKNLSELSELSAITKVDLEELQTRGLAKKPINFRFDLKNPKVIDWAEEHAAELIKDITEVSRRRIKNAIAGQLEDGEDRFDDILAAVGDQTRAERIARHESIQATSEGQRLAWGQAVEEGFLEGDETRVWIVTPDDRLCDECEELDGATAKLGEDYPGGYDGPPAHVGCRCTEGIV